MQTQPSASKTPDDVEGLHRTGGVIEGIRSYFANALTVLGLLLALCNGALLWFLFGPVIASIWTIVASSLLLLVIYLSFQKQAGVNRAELPSTIAFAILIGVWMLSASAVWMTGQRAAWVIAVLSCASWSIHIIFTSRDQSQRTMLATLTVVVAPLSYFMISAAWSGFPFWVAIPVTISSLAMLAAIADTAQRANKIFADLQAALAETAAAKVELKLAKETAENASAAKSQFLANVSHEIRTPLNGVLGMAQALQQDPLEPAEQEKLAIILDSGKSLMALLNDVLDLSKIEAGKLEISAVPGDLMHTLGRVRDLFQSTAEEKGLDLVMRHDGEIPPCLIYDPTRVRQCVSNMLSNAIKFTAAGRVDVVVSATRGADGHLLVSLHVSDTGIGMSSEVQGRLFNVFTQADGETTRKFGGSGLGLAISRQLARMMGGDLIVESEEGRGSTFKLTFKAAEGARSAATGTVDKLAVAPEPAQSSLRGARILLTDDNAINRQVIKLFLAPYGVAIVEATNGQEALDKLATQSFDLVLLDVHMPVMDGKEAVKRIRASQEPWRQLPVIALTADAMSGDREKYLALGMTDYVSKPVDQRDLIAKILRSLRVEPSRISLKTGT